MMYFCHDCYFAISSPMSLGCLCSQGYLLNPDPAHTLLCWRYLIKFRFSVFLILDSTGV